MRTGFKIGLAVAGLATVALGADYAAGEAKGLWKKVRSGYDQECRYEKTITASSSAETTDLLTVESAAGRVEVKGVDGLDRVEVEGKACASREEWLADLYATLEADGDGLLLESHYPDRNGWSSGTAALDLEVRVPAGMALRIDDSSGSLSVAGTGDLRIEDSSGAIAVERISGAVSIEDSSGSLGVAAVLGDVEIEDGSGSITVSEIGGSVTVDDGSGSIRIRRVEGDVLINDDGGGSIRVSEVGGDFIVEGDGGGGSISYDQVRGEVRVPAKWRRGGLD